LERQLDFKTKSKAREIKASVSEKRISFLRLIQAVIFPGVYWFFIDKQGTDQRIALVITLAVLLYSVFVIAGKPYKRYNPVSFGIFSSGFDTILVFLWIYATGAKDSPFFVLTIIGILSIAFRTGRVFTYLCGFVYIALYALVYFFTGTSKQELPEFAINSAFIAIATLIGAVISREVFKQTLNVLQIKKLSEDLTHTVELLKEKSKSESMLAAIVNNSQDAIISKDLNGVITSWNPGAEKVFGYKAEEIIGRNVTILFPEERLHEEEIFMNNIREGKAVKHFQTQRIKKDKTIIDVSVTLSPIRNHEGEIIGASKIGRDITEQKKVFIKVEDLNEELSVKVQQLKEINEELESFTYSVSHDLRTPLRGINGYASMLAEDYSEKLDSEGKRMLGEIKENSVKLNLLIEHLLEFSRMGRRALRHEEVDVTLLFKEAIEIYKENTKEKYQIVLNDLPKAYADKELLQQVIINLYSNAVKYSSKKSDPRIEIGSFKEKSQYVYFIKDNGAGFDMAYSDKLFGVFKRLHTDDQFEGTGVGLAIVKRIITKHGGKVWAESEPEKGATFFFTLPAI
jgi:PAS domain S-box-containing protein